MIAAAIAAILFVIVFATGFVLRASGKPYGVPQLTVHKLISLAALPVSLIVSVLAMKLSGAIRESVRRVTA